MRSLPLRGVGSAATLVVLVATAPAWAQPSDAVALLSPEAAVAAALAVHPDVRAAEAELLLARGLRSESAFLLANPQASAQTTFDGTRTSLGLTQPLSLSGEGWHARRSTSARVDATEAWLLRSRLLVAAETRIAYVDAVVAAGRVRVARDGVELASRMRRAVTRQNEEGEASLLDLRLARLGEVQAAAGLVDAREREAGTLRAMAGRIGMSVASGALVPDPLAVVPRPTRSAPDERSDIAAARAALQAAEAELRLQRAASLPPIGVGAFVEVEDGQTFIGPTLNLEIPLFDRNQAGRASARREVLAAESHVATVAARAHTEVATAGFRVAEADGLSAMLVTDPIAEAHEALASIESGYLAGEIDLPSTVLLQGEVLEGEAAAIELLGQLATARLDLLLATEDPAMLGGAP